MNLTLEQKTLLERILLTMRYDASMTLSENFLKEQGPSKAQLDAIAKDFKEKILTNKSDRLTDDQLMITAAKWGWTKPTWIPIMYTQDKKMELIKSDAKSYLKKIGWPKFGYPTKTGLDKTNPEYIKKINFLKLQKPAYGGSPYGSTNPEAQGGYKRCMEEAHPEYLPISVLEAYVDKLEYCSVYYKNYVYLPKGPENYLDTISGIIHVLAPIASVAAIFFAAPEILIVAGVLEVADVAAYLIQKDYESAGIGLIFLMIPAGQLINKIPAVKKFTSGTLKQFIKKIKRKAPLNVAERELSEQINRNGQWIIRQVAKNSAKTMAQKLFSRKFTGKLFIRLLLKLAKAGVISSKYGFRLACLGGAFVTVGMLGRKLGILISGGKTPKSEVEKQLDEVPLDVVLQEVESKQEEELSKIEKDVQTLIETSDENKNKQFTKIFKNIDKEMDDYLKTLNQETKQDIKVDTTNQNVGVDSSKINKTSDVVNFKKEQKF